MDDKQILDKQWIVDEVDKHCTSIREQLAKSDIPKDYYTDAEYVRRSVDIGYSLGNSDSCPLGYVKGERYSDTYWKSKACQCTSVNRNEQGFLELEDPESSSVSYIFCHFNYADCDYGNSRFLKIKMTTCRISESYPPLPENCLELPKATQSSAGADLVATFVIDATNDVLAYIFYEHWGYRDRPTSRWDWAHPDYDARTLVNKAIKEHGKVSIESAKAHDLLYIQKSMGSDRVAAQMACNQATSIYYQLYGYDSNHPAIISAVKRDFNAITRDSYVYYAETLSSYKHMLKIKEAHPEVTDFPDIEELRRLIEKYEPLEREEAWERHLR